MSEDNSCYVVWGIILIICGLFTFGITAIIGIIMLYHAFHKKKPKYQYITESEKRHYKPLVSEEEYIEIAQKCQPKVIICSLCGSTNAVDKVIPFTTTKQICKNCKSELGG